MSVIHLSASRFISRYFSVSLFACERRPEAPLQGGDMNTTSGALRPAKATSCSGVIAAMSAQSAGESVRYSKSRQAPRSRSMPPRDSKSRVHAQGLELRVEEPARSGADAAEWEESGVGERLGF